MADDKKVAEAELGKPKLDVDDNETVYLVGGYDGDNWLSTLDLYSPTKDIIKSSKPMRCIRSHASVVKFDDKMYAIGGGNGYLWYNSVESFDPAKNKWVKCPPLHTPKISLAACPLDNKIYALGGGNRFEWFTEVEMLDLGAGQWVFMEPMIDHRFALAATELNGAIYATGGYDGRKYLRYVISGLTDGAFSSSVHPDVEIYDPRKNAWMEGEEINFPRGFAAVVVLNDSIYVIGGIQMCEKIVDKIECYKEGQGWKVIEPNAIGKRTFAAGVVM